MKPHGSLTRARHCKCPPCTAQKTRYTKYWRVAQMRGVKLKVPADPTHRKIHALEAIGYTRRALAAELGVTGSAITNMMSEKFVLARTEVAVEKVYRKLEMKIPEHSPAGRLARKRAKANGWPPPMAYDDIQLGIVAPDSVKVGKIPHNRFDLDEIDYVMQSEDWTWRLSRPEKIEVVRRWMSTGRPQAEICRLTGWHHGRYSPNTNNQEEPS